MTNEEIRQKAEALEKEYGIDLSVSALTEFGRELVLKALEQAARLACGYCLNSLKVEQRGEYFYHPAQSYWPEKQCDAGAIRFLKESLSTEAAMV